MLYEKMISESLGVSAEVARKIMDRMSLGGFKFSSASEEQILEEAGFLKKFSLY